MDAVGHDHEAISRHQRPLFELVAGGLAHADDTRRGLHAAQQPSDEEPGQARLAEAWVGQRAERVDVVAGHHDTAWRQGARQMRIAVVDDVEYVETLGQP